MTKMLKWIALGLLPLVKCLPYNHLDDQVEAAIDAGTFMTPSNNVRPKYRYWIPDASINPDYFADDIRQLAERGAGGIEFLNYYNYGGDIGPQPTNWSIYGFGTPAYRNILKTALETSKSLGLVMDFEMGPQSGQGVPAAPDDPGLELNLNQYNSPIAGGHYDGVIPGWGTGQLISAVTFAVKSAYNISTGTQWVMAEHTLNEVTSMVQKNGTISVNVPDDSTMTYYLYTSYSARSYDRACTASSTHPQNILQNGSFAVDHFSATGAKTTTTFLENYVLIDGIKELMMEVGNYIWEDSVEIPALIYWTKDLPAIFQQRLRYNITKYLPLLAGDNGETLNPPGPLSIITDGPDQGSGFVADYRSTMTYLYTTYLDALVQWSNQYLDLQFSCQVVYGLPLDMLEAIPYVNAPETETLEFSDSIDLFRQYSGPANLAGKRIISLELGADYGRAYYQNWTGILREAKRAFVAGINQVVHHGATYSHTYPNTTWPGFTSFAYTYSGQHSRHQPAWNVGYSQAVNYEARVQWVLQTGIPKSDLVFWDKQTSENDSVLSRYYPLDLVNAGFSYEYLSPSNFELNTSFVSDKILAPSRQAFKALILRGNDTMTVSGAYHLAKYASEGLPIIISGGLPATYANNDSQAIQIANNSLTKILSLPNVHQVGYIPLAATVTKIGILPLTKVATNGTWYTKWREDTRTGDIYVFIYNDAEAYSTGTVSFQTTQKPFILDAWTGHKSPVIEYSVKNGYTVIPLTLQYTETTFILFSKSSSDAPDQHVVSSSCPVLGYVTKGSNATVAQIGPSSTSCSLELSSQKTVSVPATAKSVSGALSLTNWTLVVEKWLAPANLFDVETLANMTNATFSIPGPSLPSWMAIDVSLTNVSGIGYYSTSFAWPSSSSTSNKMHESNLGAILIVPPAAQGLTGTLNGRALPTFDIANPKITITDYVVSGENKLVLQTSTTLLNSLRPIYDMMLTGGLGPALALPLAEVEAMGYGGPTDNGIIGEVQIISYQGVSIF